MKVRFRIILSSLFLAWFVQSCIKDNVQKPFFERVLLVYMGGDNNLSHETWEKIESLKKGWSHEGNTKIVIYQDDGDENPTLCEVVRRGNENSVKLVREYQDENSASAEVLGRVIGETKSLFEARTYDLLIFSHASGWLPRGALREPTRSIVIDGDDEMDIKDFARAIPDGAFKNIVFEACFMAGIEVAYELRNKCQYILASSAEILSPGYTEVYEREINALLAGDLLRFGQEAYGYFSRQIGVMQSATFSIMRTDQLEGLAQWIGENVDPAVGIEVGEVQKFDRYLHYTLFFDFKDYFSRVLKNPSQEKINELDQLISNVVVWRAATKKFMITENGFEINKYSGLTTFIRQSRFPNLSKGYEQLEWTRKIGGKEDL